jgi:hypothetical protein
MAIVQHRGRACRIVTQLASVKWHCRDNTCNSTRRTGQGQESGKTTLGGRRRPRPLLLTGRKRLSILLRSQREDSACVSVSEAGFSLLPLNPAIRSGAGSDKALVCVRCPERILAECTYE